MSLSPQAQAVLLLTAHLSQAEKGRARPLSAAEWSRLARWLRDRDGSPEDLLCGDPDEVLQGWEDPRIPGERLKQLLGRSLALALTLERWQRAGIWVLIRSDADYPGRLKKRLRTEAPPLFFGCGNRQLLQRGGIAVVGSRRTSEENLAHAARLGAEAARQGFTLISGGAKGVDEAAMQGALTSEGTAVGVLADSLLRHATAARYRERLARGDLALLSMANPEAGFDVGNAMARNKIIYCLSDATVVVTSSRQSGGTWHGAVENLRHGWVPTWVLPDSDPGSGNSALVERGARRLPGGSAPLSVLLQWQRPTPRQASMFPNT
ncbi:MAG TPA: DNA-processing protein DprA [Thermoanaerobaculia bacterium]|nr:DNA-processing protein DprA [Thermoanaerobaculia bacterium]